MARTHWAGLVAALLVVGACASDGGESDAIAAPDASADVTTPDAGDRDAPLDPGGPLPLCECPALPASGTCRSCSSSDDRCETGAEQDVAVRCVITKGCLQREGCGDPGLQGVCQGAACVPYDTAELAPDVVETIEPDVVETIEPGSRQVGQSCADSADCANAMTCVSGQYTMAHCNPMCTTVDDCNAAFPGGNAQCAALTGGSVCIWFCGMMGGSCPGDLSCDGASCG